MPRPGPRPYECVRRAWHSDRHQSMRGSIIQQIFKVVYETHSVVTRKNKEWQEKLPIVVLKAEEILYSKANSEAEYMDNETLWDRVNDAIDTIIRKDESSESGEFLPPCVEAALNLGCVPVRASRSQRHSNPRIYLGPRAQESGAAPSIFPGGNSKERNPNLMPPHPSNQPSCSLAPLIPESNVQPVPNLNIPAASSGKDLNFPIGNNRVPWKESNTSFNTGSVYPLYYGTNFQSDVSKFGFQEPHASKDVFIGRPVFASVEKSGGMGCMRTLLSGERNEVVPSRTKQSEPAVEVTEGREGECDLSLRLGQFCGGFDPGNSQEVGKNKAVSSSRDKDASPVLIQTSNDHSMLHLGRSALEMGDQNADAFLRKRKLPFHGHVDNRQPFHGNVDNRQPFHGNVDNRQPFHGNVDSRLPFHGNVDSRQRFWPLYPTPTPPPTPHQFYDQMKRQSS